MLVPRYGLEASINVNDKLQRAFSPSSYSLHHDAELHVLHIHNSDPKYASNKLQVFDQVEVLIHVEDRSNGSRALVLDLVQPMIYPQPILNSNGADEQQPAIEVDESVEQQAQLAPKRRKSAQGDKTSNGAISKRRKK